MFFRVLGFRVCGFCPSTVVPFSFLTWGLVVITSGLPGGEALDSHCDCFGVFYEDFNIQDMQGNFTVA